MVIKCKFYAVDVFCDLRKVPGTINGENPSIFKSRLVNFNFLLYWLPPSANVWLLRILIGTYTNPIPSICFLKLDIGSV